jgi:hypothetical protein
VPARLMLCFHSVGRDAGAFVGFSFSVGPTCHCNLPFGIDAGAVQPDGRFINCRCSAVCPSSLIALLTCWVQYAYETCIPYLCKADVGHNSGCSMNLLARPFKLGRKGRLCRGMPYTFADDGADLTDTSPQLLAPKQVTSPTALQHCSPARLFIPFRYAWHRCRGNPATNLGCGVCSGHTYT